MGSLGSWEPGKPRIFQKGYKEPTKFEEGKVSLIGDNQIGNPQNEIPNDDPE